MAVKLLSNHVPGTVPLQNQVLSNRVLGSVPSARRRRHTQPSSQSCSANLQRVVTVSGFLSWCECVLCVRGCVVPLKAGASFLAYAACILFLFHCCLVQSHRKIGGQLKGE